MAAGYAGLEDLLFDLDKTMMVFGDAKKAVEDLVKAVEKRHPVGGGGGELAALH